MSHLENQFAMQLDMLGLPTPTREHRFHPTRKWRFDFAWPSKLMAVEIEGGAFTNGRHNRAHGFAEDCRKYNVAASMGWRVFRFTGEMVASGEAVQTVEEVLK